MREKVEKEKSCERKSMNEIEIGRVMKDKNRGRSWLARSADRENNVGGRGVMDKEGREGKREISEADLMDQEEGTDTMREERNEPEERKRGIFKVERRGDTERVRKGESVCLKEVKVWGNKEDASEDEIIDMR